MGFSESLARTPSSLEWIDSVHGILEDDFATMKVEIMHRADRKAWLLLYERLHLYPPEPDFDGLEQRVLVKFVWLAAVIRRGGRYSYQWDRWLGATSIRRSKCIRMRTSKAHADENLWNCGSTVNREGSYLANWIGNATVAPRLVNLRSTPCIYVHPLTPNLTCMISFDKELDLQPSSSSSHYAVSQFRVFSVT